MGEPVTPYRSLPVAQPAPVYCLHCVHRDEGNDCALSYQYSAPHPINGRIRVIAYQSCAARNVGRDCTDFLERPLSLWERIFGRRYP